MIIFLFSSLSISIYIFDFVSGSIPIKYARHAIFINIPKIVSMYANTNILLSL